MRVYRIGTALAVPAIVILAAGGGLTAAAAAASPATVFTWGDNSAGELASGALTASTTPAAVGGASGVRAIAAGGRHVLALLSGGTVEAWGDDTSGQLGDGMTGSVHDAETPVAVTGLSDVTQVSAGAEHSLALLANGTVMAWGDNSRGELGNGSTVSSDVPVPVTGLAHVTAVAAGDECSLALLADGTVMAWGDGGNGQLGDGKFRNVQDTPVAVKTLTGVTAIAAGGQHALALLSGGAVAAWGENSDGQLGNGGPPGASDVPVMVQGLSTAVAVSAGEEHSLALLSNGTVMARGDNGFDELGQSDGIGGIQSSNVPVQVPGLAGVSAISAGGLFSLALLSGGTVDAWGDGAFGQLGSGSTNTVAPPTPVTGLTGVTAVSAAGVSSAALVSGSPPGPPQPVPGIWRVTRTPGPPRVTQVADLSFNGVSAAGAADAWAVGSHSANGASLPLAEHWNGSSWSRSAVPLPSGATSATLNGIDTLGQDNAWAVGSTGAEQSLIEHWNGQTWSVVPSPDPGIDNTLEAVSGTGPDDLWAVGWFENTQQTFVALLLAHWNGTAWSFVAPPTEGGIQFGQAVTAISRDNVWVVGDTGSQATLSAHWNGTAWTMVTTPFLVSKDSQNFLTGVTATSGKNVWASGYEGNVNDALFDEPYMLHWTGAAWHLVKMPNAGTEGSSLRGTVALSASDVWAVGITGQTDGALLALTEHFNGTAWSAVPAADPGQLGAAPDNSLDAVASPGNGDLWAVGAQEVPGQCCLRALAMTTPSG